MNNEDLDFDHIDQEIATHEISDERLEAAAKPRASDKSTYSIISPFCV